MSKLASKAENQVRKIVSDALKSAMESGALCQCELPAISVEIPADTSHGDYSSNAAMACARAFRCAPAKIASEIVSRADLSDTFFTSVETAGPGFLNFRLSPSYFSQVVLDVLEKGDEYGRSDYGQGKKVMVEFVSANPTGPMHLGNARGGALGDCLASLLDTAGYDVWREFYVNDAGNQIDKFGLSLDVRYLQLCLGEDAVEMPEDAYHGDDIREHAAAFKEINGDSYVSKSEEERRAALVAYALPLNIQKMQADLRKYRIEYDRWFLESTVHKSGELAETIKILTDRGLTYEKDGGLWYKNTEVMTAKLKAEGKSEEEIAKLELKDDCLIRPNGNPTYFAADIAYHRNKFLRGFDTCINFWGADHHGHVARMKGAMDAVGLDGEKLKVVLFQLVKLVRNGEVVRMSKRSGKAIQLADLLDEVPVDAARFFFNLREANTGLDFDLDLAVSQTSQNPVYYVQYAHARICSILKNLSAEGVVARKAAPEELDLLTAPEERELIRHLAAYTGAVVNCAQILDSSGMTRYAVELATLFHKFYNACRVKCGDESLMQARLSLCLAVRQAVKNLLTMLGIDAPEVM